MLYMRKSNIGYLGGVQGANKARGAGRGTGQVRNKEILLPKNASNACRADRRDSTV